MKNNINLLGVCDKYNETPIGVAKNNLGETFTINRKDIIGLKEFHISNIFPFLANSFFIVLLIDTEWLISNKGGVKLFVNGSDGKSMGTINIQGKLLQSGKISQKYILQATRLDGVYLKPDTFTLIIDEDGKKYEIGSYNLVYQKALPLTRERIQAIKSDPLSIKYLKYELKCKKCNEKISVFCGINKGKKEDTVDNIWYEDLPDNFKCKCGETEYELKYMKESMHALLGYKENKFSYDQGIERSYTLGALETIANDFNKLINDDNLLEENYQKFIESNPIIFSIFTPKLLKFKSPITSKFKTDFVVLNPRNELLLIEIEKPTTKLFKKDGTQHSELTHALDQVENWLIAGNRNRLALIDDINIDGLTLDNVTNIKGVVIAGRNKIEDANHIEKIRSRGNIDFYTYDDLFKSLAVTISSYRKL